ncbi:MAG: ATP-binding protein [SAR202 cluster bacterium]|nr:ATP-binding protein [SAR202 cluster bacterium]
MSWFARSKNTEQNLGVELASTSQSVSQSVLDLLELLDAENIVLGKGDVVLKKSSGISTLNLVRDQFINHEALLRLVRAARKSGKMQEVTLDLPRGPIGAGTHDLFVRVSPIGNSGLVVVLIFDDSEMRRLDSIRRDFVANISHELKTPIGALSILSEAVLGAKDDPEAITRFASRMQSEAGRLTELVQKIINLSRLQDDDPLKRAQPFLISESIKEAIDQSRLNAEIRKVEIVYNNDNKMLVNGDRDQVTMAIHNLIENAINYSPDATRVAIAVKEKNEICEIIVSDQGIGIPEKDLERIFERFYRVDAARSRVTGGTGLGLSIVKHVVTNHGGDISVWSIEGAGSTFTIRLPLAKEYSSKSESNPGVSK